MSGPFLLPLLRHATSSASFTSPWARVPVGSSIRAMIAVTAVAGTPAATLALQLKNYHDDPVTILALPISGIGTFTDVAPLVSDSIRVVLSQAGPPNSITGSIDLIVAPPHNAPT